MQHTNPNYNSNSISPHSAEQRRKTSYHRTLFLLKETHQKLTH